MLKDVTAADAKILYCRPKDLDVRIEYDLCAEEKSFLNKRRKYVHASVKKALQLQEVLQDDEKNCHTLSEQQMAVSEGQNPLPIYLAVNLKNKYSAQDFREWLEFTPYEVGSFKYGAYIRSEDFGSEYFMGRLMKKLPESRMCFMEGMWSSIFSLDFMYVWSLASDSEDFWYKWTRDRVHDIGKLLESFTNLDQFSAYASKQGIPFPHIELSEEDRENLKECYVFKDEDNAAVPIVLFFPLTNDTYKKYESPGVERSPANMAEGNVDVSSIFSPFTTREVSFSEKNFNRLNILELKVCDEDKHTKDDHLLTVFFDVSKIQLGETVCLNFQLNPKSRCSRKDFY
ncbi:Cytosolic phospholipase A2 epsilon [Varanus komodoensis]|nr:Cytosolic phospholipase A2 epsilon [Varanus komodoensis]